MDASTEHMSTSKFVSAWAWQLLTAFLTLYILGDKFVGVLIIMLFMIFCLLALALLYFEDELGIAKVNLGQQVEVVKVYVGQQIEKADPYIGRFVNIFKGLALFCVISVYYVVSFCGVYIPFLLKVGILMAAGLSRPGVHIYLLVAAPITGFYFYHAAMCVYTLLWQGLVHRYLGGSPPPDTQKRNQAKQDLAASLRNWVILQLVLFVLAVTAAVHVGSKARQEELNLWANLHFRCEEGLTRREELLYPLV